MTNTIDNDNNTAIVTTKEFAELIGSDYLGATALLKYMIRMGIVKESGKRDPEGRGKPSQLFEIPNAVELVFWEKNDDVKDPDTQIVEVEAIEEKTELNESVEMGVAAASIPA